MFYLKFIGIFVALFLAVLYLGQRYLIYPGGTWNRQKAPFIREGAEKIPLTSKDGTPGYMLALKAAAPSSRAILCFHGNNDTAGNLLAHMEEEGIGAPGYDLFSLEYRGYGGNPGSPSEEGLTLDALAALDFLRAKGYKEIVFFAHSLGTGVAVSLLKRADPPRALILLSPFSSLQKMAEIQLAFLPKFLVRVMLKDKFLSEETLAEKQVSALLVLHAKDDDIIPFGLGAALFKKAKGPKKVFKAYEAGGHNNLIRLGAEDIKAFLASLPPPS